MGADLMAHPEVCTLWSHGFLDTKIFKAKNLMNSATSLVLQKGFKAEFGTTAGANHL